MLALETKQSGGKLLPHSDHFTEPEGSLPHSQASPNCLYPGPAQSSPSTHIPPPGDLFPLETLPPHPENPSGAVVYLRTVLSPEQASRMCVFLNISVLQGAVVSTSPNPQAGGPSLVRCPRLLIQFICSYPP